MTSNFWADEIYSVNKEIQISKSIMDAPFTITPPMRNEKIITKFSFLMEFFKKSWQHQFSFCNKACQGQRRNAYLLQHYSQTLSNKVLLWALIKPKLWNQVPASDHLVINSVNFLCWKLRLAGSFDVQGSQPILICKQ